MWRAGLDRVSASKKQAPCHELPLFYTITDVTHFYRKWDFSPTKSQDLIRLLAKLRFPIKLGMKSFRHSVLDAESKNEFCKNSIVITIKANRWD